MGGRGASSMGSKSFAERTFSKDHWSRIEQNASGEHYRLRERALDALRANEIDGTELEDTLRADRDLYRLGFVVGDSLKASALTDWAQGRERPIWMNSADWTKTQTLSRSLLERYEARDVSAFAKYGHLLNGKIL